MEVGQHMTANYVSRAVMPSYGCLSGLQCYLLFMAFSLSKMFLVTRPQVDLHMGLQATGQEGNNAQAHRSLTTNAQEHPIRVQDSITICELDL